MSVASGVILLASYPKSGNTWLRCLADSLVHGGEPPNLRRVGKICPNGAVRQWLEGVLEVDLRDLSSDELALWRGEALRHCVAAGTGPVPLVKVHDRFDPVLFPADAVSAVIFVVRDPRDVAPSLAHHLGVSLDGAIERMGRPDFALARQTDFFRDQAVQMLGSWSAHAQSWLDAAERFPTLMLRYEELSNDPTPEVVRFAAMLGLAPDLDLIERAIRVCGFDALRQAEEKDGFAERPPAADRFFRQGRAGTWRVSMTESQVRRIEEDHAAVMMRLGYALSNPGTP